MSAAEKRKIADIKIGERHRKDFGDLEALAESIKANGLLQPIGITENDELVFGERRLRATRDILGLDEIEVRVVNVAAIVDGEFAENAIRKDFTVSERVAILGAMKRFSHGGQRGSGQGENFRLAQAAEIAGFSNPRTAQAAKAVVDKAAPELVEAMDAGKVSIDAASRLAKLPMEEQREVVAKDEKEIRQRVAAMRASPPHKVTGAGSKFSRSRIATMTVPKTAKQAATAIIKGFGSLSLVEDLIQELQARVAVARAEQA